MWTLRHEDHSVSSIQISNADKVHLDLYDAIEKGLEI